VVQDAEAREAVVNREREVLLEAVACLRFEIRRPLGAKHPGCHEWLDRADSGWTVEAALLAESAAYAWSDGPEGRPMNRCSCEESLYLREAMVRLYAILDGTGTALATRREALEILLAVEAGRELPTYHGPGGR
jgi:hypothetical protein